MIVIQMQILKFAVVAMELTSLWIVNTRDNFFFQQNESIADLFIGSLDICLFLISLDDRLAHIFILDILLLFHFWLSDPVVQTLDFNPPVI